LERKITQRWADLAIGNSQRVTDELIEIDGVGSDRAVTIHNGVETSGGSRLDVASEPVIFSSVANFRKLKGHDIFVRAAEKIAKVRPECLFWLLGQDQGTEAETRRALEASPIPHWKIHGPASSPQDVYANSSVLLYTSMSEGFSNVILEAMASGLPVIAADVGGNREAIVDGETGFLVPAGSVDAFVEKALRLANEPQLRTRMGEAGRVRAQTMFSVGAMVEAYEKVYADTLSNESRVAACASGNIQSI
jgi:glycosyltransferase involved in cell wall biosynthesis